MKTKLFHLMTASLLTCLFTLKAYALDVQLEFKNQTNQSIKPQATITYKQEGNTFVDEPIQPSQEFIPAHTANTPVDILRKNLDFYLLNYFELFDAQGNYITNCFDGYLTVDKKSAVVTMTLTQIGKTNPKYKCTYNIEYL